MVGGPTCGWTGVDLTEKSENSHFGGHTGLAACLKKSEAPKSGWGGAGGGDGRPQTGPPKSMRKAQAARVGGVGGKRKGTSAAAAQNVFERGQRCCC